MNLATLRVEGDEEALSRLSKGLGRNPDVTWKKGEARHRGGFHTASGFSVTIADVVKAEEMISAVRQFLNDCNGRGLIFSGTNLSSELAVGFTVGDSLRFVGGVSLTAKDLSLLASLGLDFTVVAYPSSDERPEPDETA